MIILHSKIRDIVRQMLEIGVRSLPAVLVAAIFTVMVLSLQTFTGFKYIVTVEMFKMSSVVYWMRAWYYLELSDRYNELIKTCFFCSAIALVSCYKGIYTSGGAEGVGKATNGAVVLSSMTILNENAKITGIIWDFSMMKKVLKIRMQRSVRSILS